MLITLEKRAVGWKRRPFQGWAAWNAWQTALWADNSSEFYEQELRIFARSDASSAPEEAIAVRMRAAARTHY